ncbi:MAG TPA: hypothetical protein ENN14_01295 [Chloroflexi bacterium]|nr:hypothetical protein [Chloroflexota bacterium]
MNYRDEYHVCEQCGKKFVFRVEEQRTQAELGFEVNTPSRCPKCRQQSEPEPGLRPGIVKFYDQSKGFGFIIEQSGAEVFFHRTGITGDVDAVTQEHAEVWYELEMTDRGPQAINVMSRV